VGKKQELEMNLRDPDMPVLTGRVLQLIDHFSNGNVSRFVSDINETNPAEYQLFQQTLNRIFNLDGRGEKYPSVSSQILVSILIAFPEINADWLMRGQGEMIVKNIEVEGEDIEDKTNSGDKGQQPKSFLEQLAEDLQAKAADLQAFANKMKSEDPSKKDTSAFSEAHKIFSDGTKAKKHKPGKDQ